MWSPAALLPVAFTGEPECAKELPSLFLQISQEWRPITTSSSLRWAVPAQVLAWDEGPQRRGLHHNPQSSPTPWVSALRVRPSSLLFNALLMRGRGAPWLALPEPILVDGNGWPLLYTWVPGHPHSCSPAPFTPTSHHCRMAPAPPIPCSTPARAGPFPKAPHPTRAQELCPALQAHPNRPAWQPGGPCCAHHPRSLPLSHCRQPEAVVRRECLSPC